jgi:hypothetical protein
MEWHSEPEADTNRNTIDWISKKTDEVCGELDDVLEELNPWEAIMNTSLKIALPHCRTTSAWHPPALSAIW